MEIIYSRALSLSLGLSRFPAKRPESGDRVYQIKK
jgi:hypothetical protein